VTTLAPLDVSQAWDEFDQKARSEESAYEKAALGQFAAEATAVVRMLEANIPSFKKADSPSDAITISLIWPYLEAAFLKIMAAYSASGTFVRQWYNRFRPIIAKTMAQAEAPSVRIGILGPTSPQMLSAIQRRVTKLSGQVTETTAQQIRDVMTKAREDGVGVSELARRIRSDVFGDSITATRATTIARTETVGALNEGAMVKARASGVFRAKHWISQKDNRVRDSHKSAESEGWIPIDQQYSNGLDYPHQPGAPAEEVINCRCSQTFTDLTADEANRGAG
jgi:hypothetical protein